MNSRREIVLALAGAGSEYFARAIGFIGPMQSLAETQPKQQERTFILDTGEIHEHFGSHAAAYIKRCQLERALEVLYRELDEFQICPVGHMEGPLPPRRTFLIESGPRHELEDFADLIFKEVSAKMRSSAYELSLFLAGQTENPPFITRKFPRIPQAPARVSKYHNFFRSRPRSQL